MKSLLTLPLLTLGIGGAIPRPATPAPAPVFCAVTVLRDYDMWVTYYAQLRLDPACPAGGSARVRKSSTTSLKVDGAKYQPVLPLTGAWTLSKTSSDIPPRAHFTLNTWEWQFYDGQGWKSAVTK